MEVSKSRQDEDTDLIVICGVNTGLQLDLHMGVILPG